MEGCVFVVQTAKASELGKKIKSLPKLSGDEIGF